ncbi:MAG: alpha/beta hydrolase [Bacteroidales bacterium]|nr:alpha/beta hydrolase [Bacteroidales bacterium]
MRRYIAIWTMVLATVFAAMPLGAKSKYKYYPATELRPDQTVFLYATDVRKIVKSLPDPVVSSKSVETLALVPKVESGLAGAEEMFYQNGATRNINGTARFDLYFPKNPNGQMVVVIPGGGYGCVCHFDEGSLPAEWLVERGITVAVAKYRLPNGHPEVPLDDIQTILNYCRENAAEWGVSQVGVMGFSAGGHLAAYASTFYYDAATRPDFAVLFYPVINLRSEFGHVETGTNLIGNPPQVAADADEEAQRAADRSLREYNRKLDRYCLENDVTYDTPPTFIVLGADDSIVDPDNAIVYFKALHKSNVPTEMHVFRSGQHGFSFVSRRYAPSDLLGDSRTALETALDRWLRSLQQK